MAADSSDTVQNGLTVGAGDELGVGSAMLRAGLTVGSALGATASWLGLELGLPSAATPFEVRPPNAATATTGPAASRPDPTRPSADHAPGGRRGRGASAGRRALALTACHSPRIRSVFRLGSITRSPAWLGRG